MSFRVGGARSRRIRGKGTARKAERASKSAADLDAEMEVCKTFFCCLPLAETFCPSGLYCQQWSCCCCLSIAFLSSSLACLLCTSFYVVLFSIQLFIPSSVSWLNVILFRVCLVTSSTFVTFLRWRILVSVNCSAVSSHFLCVHARSVQLLKLPHLSMVI